MKWNVSFEDKHLVETMNLATIDRRYVAAVTGLSDLVLNPGEKRTRQDKL